MKEPLSLNHQAILQPLFASLNLPLSEYSFASRYLFRREHDLHFISENNRIWLQGKTRDGVRYLMPTQDLRQIPLYELQEKSKETDCFYPIPETWLLPSFRAIHSIDDSDYLYKREKIAEYPGRHLSAKRNLVKQFIESYQAKTIPYQKQQLQEALFILDSWQKNMGSANTDYLACKDALELAPQLNLTGCLIFANDSPAAFILGEALNPNTFAIHFAKALTDYKGIYPFLFKELASQLTFTYLNWEQDLGQKGLRQSKQSYQPDFMAHKFRAFINT